MLVGLMVILTLLAARSQVSALPSRLFEDLVDQVIVISPFVPAEAKA
jgi:hypothetical protein